MHSGVNVYVSVLFLDLAAGFKVTDVIPFEAAGFDFGGSDLPVAEKKRKRKEVRGQHCCPD